MDGQNITSLPDYKRSKFIGRLFQDPLKGTAPSMTIEENLALAYLRASEKRSPFSVVTAKDRAGFREKLAQLELGLEDRMDHPVGLLSGGLLAQYQKSCDINVGTGMVTIALASLIIGETLVGKRTMLRRILGVVFGSCLYRFIVAVALRFNVPAAAMKLVSAIIVAVAISMPAIREHFAFEKRRHAARARRTVTNREGQ